MTGGVQPSWEEEPALWDTVTLGGIDLPGIADVDAKVGRKLDTRSASGSDGGTIVDKGYKLAPVKVTLTLWTTEHHAAWARTLPSLVALRGRQRVPLAIIHPSLHQLGIRSVYLESVGNLRPSSRLRGGGYEVALELVQYRPASRDDRTHRARGNFSLRGPLQFDDRIAVPEIERGIQEDLRRARAARPSNVSTTP